MIDSINKIVEFRDVIDSFSSVVTISGMYTVIQQLQGSILNKHREIVLLLLVHGPCTAYSFVLCI